MLEGRVDEEGTGSGPGSPIVRRIRVLGLLSFSWEANAPIVALILARPKVGLLDNPLDVFFRYIVTFGKGVCSWVTRWVDVLALASAGSGCDPPCRPILP